MGANKDQIARAAEAVVEPGEVVELTSNAVIGSLKLGRQVAIAAATAIVTGGLLSVEVTPKQQPIVLTTRRLLVLGLKNTFTDQADSKIRSEIPRAGLRAKPARRVMLYHQLDLTDPEGAPVARMKFGLFDGADARRLGEALGQPPAG
ncbi:MAG TPA: hypothetical protein VFL29_13430 [Candidatus Dormibacteraeota bacterium]|nr:hypothetical protein [Candidatus Dormibacteraeota bacterium]